MFCTKCGAEIQDGSFFCTECGTRIIEKKNNTKFFVVTGILLIIGLLLIGRITVTNPKKGKDGENLGDYIVEENSALDTTTSEFVSDCLQEDYNKVGNTFSNLIEGGEVTWQGNWMYYVRSAGGWGNDAWGCQEICKEPLEGGTPTVIYTSADEDNDIKYLNVVGDYIYFLENYSIKRIRCDGEEYKDFGIDSRYKFSVYENQIVYTKEVHESAESSWWTLVLHDVVTGAEQDLQEKVDPHFWGMEELEDTVIFYMGQPSIDTNGYRVAYYEIKENLSEGFEDGYVTFNYSDPPMIQVYRFWQKKMISGTSIYDIPSEQLLCDKEINKTNQISFSGVYLNMNFIDDYIVGCGRHPGTFNGLMYCTIEEYLNNEYHVINGDEPSSILCAGQWIYYTCNDGVHRVKLDGSGYQQVKRNTN